MTARERLLSVLAVELVEAIEAMVAERVGEALDAARDEQADGRVWLTLEQAAERLGCSADAVRMRVKRGRLEARRQGRRLYVSAASLERLA